MSRVLLFFWPEGLPCFHEGIRLFMYPFSSLGKTTVPLPVLLEWGFRALARSFTLGRFFPFFPYLPHTCFLCAMMLSCVCLSGDLSIGTAILFFPRPLFSAPRKSSFGQHQPTFITYAPIKPDKHPFTPDSSALARSLFLNYVTLVFERRISERPRRPPPPSCRAIVVFQLEARLCGVLLPLTPLRWKPILLRNKQRRFSWSISVTDAGP